MPDLLTDPTRPRRADPLDATTQINLRVPYHYRETLIAAANKQKISLNRLLCNALVSVIKPER